MTPLLILIAVIALIDLLAPRYGVDSRDGRDWQDRCSGPAPCR